MTRSADLLLSALIHPEDIPERSLAELDLLVRQARVASLQARLRVLLAEQGRLADLAERPRRHFEAAATVAARQHDMVRWEVAQLHRALAARGIPFVLLKGAAYVMAELPSARGRLFNDVDILVPRAALKEAETLLFAHGWIAQGHDAYDQHYYRQWMHELPPLTHVRRKSVLDVHHTILPPTARPKPDPEKLLAAAVPIEQHDGVYVLAPADMVLHSATHLFHDGELENGLRDLVDMDDLVRHFGTESGFWPGLVERAFEMELARPLYYALRYAERFLDTSVPASVSEALARAAPTSLWRPVMDGLFQRGLVPHHPSCDGRLSPAARWLLYVRSHYLRMPLQLLVPHLIRKAVKRHTAQEAVQ